MPPIPLIPRFSHVAEALASANAREMDRAIEKAALEDARETLREYYCEFLKNLRTPETVRKRVLQILTRLGWIEVSYPYTVGKVTGVQVSKELCGPEQAVRKRTKDGRTRGLPKATRAARQTAAEAVALLSSVDEAQRFLKKNCGLAGDGAQDRAGGGKADAGGGRGRNAGGHAAPGVDAAAGRGHGTPHDGA